MYTLFKTDSHTLSHAAQLVEHHPTKHKVTGLIPGQCTSLLWVQFLDGVRTRGNQLVFLTLIFLFLSFSLPFPLFKKNK